MNLMNDTIPVLVAIIVAVLGSFGGVAALVRVNADRNNTLTETASKVVAMVNDQLDDHNKRLDALEEYVSHMDSWADRLLDILDRAIAMISPSDAVPFIEETRFLKSERPKRKNV